MPDIILFQKWRTNFMVQVFKKRINWYTRWIFHRVFLEWWVIIAVFSNWDLNFQSSTFLISYHAILWLWLKLQLNLADIVAFADIEDVYQPASSCFPPASPIPLPLLLTGGQSWPWFGLYCSLWSFFDQCLRCFYLCRDSQRVSVSPSACLLRLFESANDQLNKRV